MIRKRIKGCFDNADKLKGHNPGVFCGFLEEFDDFLTENNIKLPKNRDEDKIPHDALLEALMSSDSPEELVVLLILINKLGSEKGWDEVVREAKLRGVKLPDGLDKLTYSDRAMKVWTESHKKHPDLLEESFARARIYNKSSYTYYPMSRNMRGLFKVPSDEQVQELAKELDSHFNVDQGTKVLMYDFDAEIWFLIRHPGITKWQGVYEKGQAKSKAITPELYDAVIYDKKYGDLRMNTTRKSDHTAYRIAFGHLLFNASNVFDSKKNIIRLDPLKGDAVELCKTADIAGLHKIHVSEVSFFALSQDARRVTWRAEKQNESLPLDASNWVVPLDTDSILYVKLRYQLKPGGKWKSMTVHTGKILSHERDGDSCVLEDYLRLRGFIGGLFI